MVELAIAGRKPVEKAIPFGRMSSVPSAEVTLLDWAELRKRPRLTPQPVRLAAQASSDLLADIWAGIAVGTICNQAPLGAKVITWGSQHWPEEFRTSAFAHSYAGIVALQLAKSVVTDVIGLEVPASAVERVISLQHRGVVNMGGGGTRALVEFDPQQPTSLALQGRSGQQQAPQIRRQLFEQVILRFRRDLEVGNLSRNIPHANAGGIKALTTFLGELHDNAFEHGRQLKSENAGCGFRALRIRKHITKTKDELLAKADGIPELRQYLDQVTYGGSQQCVIEASVSDFGPGIVDHFLSSPQGQLYGAFSRGVLLDRIIAERISAKGSDSSAGQGIKRALIAAKGMAGFVSLRTGEFWLHQSFATGEAELRLIPVGDRQRGKVAGTHWQFFWPQPL